MIKVKHTLIILLSFLFFSSNLFSQNIRQGSSSYGTILYNYDGKNLRQGSSSYGTILFNINGLIPKSILLVLCL